MTKKNNRDILAAVVRNAAIAEAVLLIVIFIFTKRLIYCIISITGAAISITGFVLLIKSADRLLKKGKGKAMFFLLAQAKLLIIAAVFYAFSRLAKTGVVFFVQGIAIVYLAIMIEGLAHWTGRAGHGA